MKASNPPYPHQRFAWVKAGTAIPKGMQISSHSATRVLALISLLFGLFFLLLVTVWIHIDFVHLGYRVAQLKHQERKLKFENRDLKLQEEYLLGHPRLQELARKKFHLRPLTPEQVIIADEKGQF